MQRCLRCNRQIKSEKSIERGYGSGCWKIVNQQNVVHTKLEDYF